MSFAKTDRLNSASASSFGSIPNLSLCQVRKTFGSHEVLKGVDLDFYQGEVTGLIGANGAGKSTLMKIISGNLSPCDGKILRKGKTAQLRGPTDAFGLGIYMIPQELGLVKDLNAIDNILLGKQPSRFFGICDEKQALLTARQCLSAVGAEQIPLNLPVSVLSPGVQQQVAIARSLIFDSEILILDEPTSMLTDSETKCLHRIIDELRSQGKTIIYITHRLSELFSIADRVVALRDGTISGQQKIEATSESEMVKWMVGDVFECTVKRADKHSKHPHKRKMLSVRGLSNPAIHDISFDLHEGEILGLIGLMGSGRTEIMRAVAGADPVQTGTIQVNGSEVTTGSIRHAIDRGILIAPEDRRNQGLLLDQSVGFNAFIPNYEKFSAFGFLKSKAEEDAFSMVKERIPLNVKAHWQLASTLSGGNQQRLILGKILMRGGNVLLLDEVTTGVDVMTKAQILEKIICLAEEGKSILFASSEWEEVTEIADRVLLIKEGRIIGSFSRAEFNNEKLLATLVGASPVSSAQKKSRTIGALPDFEVAQKKEVSQ